jgi:hypothetical protein
MFEPTLERHIHKWRKVEGQNKAYCTAFKGCDKTRDYYPVGQIPLTGQTSHFTYPHSKRKGVDFYECAVCGVFIDKRKPHACDGAAGKAQRDKVTSEVLGQMNKFFFGAK